MTLSAPSSSSCANILTIVESDAETYNYDGLFISGGNNIGGFNKYVLISSIALWCSGSHMNPSSFLKRSKGRKTFVLQLIFEINLLKKFIFPRLGIEYSLCFLWLISMPLLWIIKPRKSHVWTPKAHFNGFILSPYSLVLSKDCWGWSRWPFFDEDLMTMSSVYTCIKVSMKSWNICFIALWYVAPTFFRTKGIIIHS